MYNRKSIVVLLAAIISIKETEGQSQRIPLSTSSLAAKEYYQRGFRHEDYGDLSLAAEQYKKAVEADTAFALGYLALAMVQGESSERRKYVEKAMQFIENVSEGERQWILGRNAFYGTGKDAEEFPAFEKLVQVHPEDPVAQYLYGYMLHHHGRKNYPKAIEHLEKAIRLDPKYITPYNDLAYAYMENNDFRNAERILLLNIQLQPDKVNPYDSYAEMLMRTGRYSESLDYYDKVLKMDPAYPWATFGKASNLNFLGRHAEARHIIKPLLNLKLTERETWHVMQAIECSYVDEGKPDSAIMTLMDHAELAKQKNYFTQQYIAYRNSTRIYFEYNQPDKGWEQYKKLNELVQNGSRSEDAKKQTENLGRYYQAYYFFLQGKMTEAITELEEYSKLRGRLDDAGKILKAKIFINDKRSPEAIELLRQCDQDNPYTQYWLAEACNANGNKAGATKLYKAVVTKNMMQDLEYHLVRQKALQKL